jgi:glycosyltransferase involved in cell wall biosynthesis
MIELSIIVPFYNTEKYFHQCLKSLYEECCADSRIEIILVDDGSSDKSVSIANEYLSKIPNQMYLISQKNQGQSIATNNAILKAKGTHISFIDSDDWIDKGMFSRMLNIALRDNVDMVICDFKKVFLNGRTKIYQYLQPSQEIINPQKYKRAIFECGFSPWNKLVKKSLFEKNHLYFPKDIMYQDLFLFVLLISKIDSIINIGVPYYNYRIRNDSLIHSWNKNVYDIFKVIEMLQIQLDSSYYEELEYLAVNEICFISFARYIQYDTEEFKYYFISSVDFILKRFPYWKENKYLKEKSILHTLYLFFIFKKKFLAVKIVLKIKNLFNFYNVPF